MFTVHFKNRSSIGIESVSHLKDLLLYNILVHDELCGEFGSLRELFISFLMSHRLAALIPTICSKKQLKIVNYETHSLPSFVSIFAIQNMNF